jgi:hypothetical protein
MAHDLLLGETEDDWSRDSSMGSVLLPAKQQRALFEKIDDVRYDVRGAKRVVGAALFALSGALAFLGIASIYRTAKSEQRKGR